MKFPDGHETNTVPAADHRRGPDRAEGGRQVLGRVGLAERAADRAPVAHDRIRDDPFRVVQNREVLTGRRRAEQLRVPDEGADPQLIVLDRNPGQPVDPVDVDQGFRLGQPQLHHRDQAVAAREHPGFGPEPGQQLERMLHARRSLVLHVRRNLH